jgi:hypothetical protein
MEEADVQRRVKRRVDVPDRGRESQVRMGLDQARHDRGPGAVHDLVAGLDRGAAAGPHALDAVAQNHHVGRHRRSTGPVEDLPVDEQNAIHIQK